GALEFDPVRGVLTRSGIKTNDIDRGLRRSSASDATTSIAGSDAAPRQTRAPLARRAGLGARLHRLTTIKAPLVNTAALRVFSVSGDTEGTFSARLSQTASIPGSAERHSVEINEQFLNYY